MALKPTVDPTILPVVSTDDLFKALVMLDEYSVIPELSGAMPTKYLLKTMEILGGMTVKFPRLTDVTRMIRNLQIYRKSVREGASARALANENDISVKSVTRIISDVQDVLDAGIRKPDFGGTDDE